MAQRTNSQPAVKGMVLRTTLEILDALYSAGLTQPYDKANYSIRIGNAMDNVVLCRLIPEQFVEIEQ